MPFALFRKTEQL